MEFFLNVYRSFVGDGTNRRLLERSIFLWALTLAGFLLLDVLVEKSRVGDWGIVARYPEFMLLMKAASVLAFIEVSLVWIRIAIQPKVDVQEAYRRSLEEPLSAAIAHFTNLIWWAVRAYLFLRLAELI